MYYQMNIMKILQFKLSFIIVLAVCFSSCRDDIGNYNYHEINELTISGIEESYSALTGQEISIQPVFHFTQGTGNEEEYRYEWISMQDGALNTTVRRLLSTSRNLDTILTLPAADYTIYYRVTEKATGLQWRRVFKLSVTSEIRDGWLVLNDINGQARLDMLAYRPATESFQRYTDILASTSSGITLKGKPVLVYALRNRDVFSSQFTSRIYVGTDQATYSINNQTFEWDNNRNLKSEIMRPVPEDYHAIQIVSMGGDITYIVDSEGVVSVENLTQALMHGPTLNRLNEGGRISISPYVAEHYRSGNYLVMFDTAQRRFIVHSGTNRVSLVPTANPADVFNPADIGLDLRFMMFTPALSGHYVAVLKQPDDDRHYLLRFARASTSVFSPLSFEEMVDAPEIAQAERFAVDPREAYLFYQSGSKIYQFDPFSRTTRMMLDVGNRKVSLMKYYRTTVSHSNPRYVEYSQKLMICTYDESSPETSGKIDLYNVPNLNQALSLFASYDGFGKVVDVSYRE